MEKSVADLVNTVCKKKWPEGLYCFVFGVYEIARIPDDWEAALKELMKGWKRNGWGMAVKAVFEDGNELNQAAYETGIGAYDIREYLMGVHKSLNEPMRKLMLLKGYKIGKQEEKEAAEKEKLEEQRLLEEAEQKRRVEYKGYIDSLTDTIDKTIRNLYEMFHGCRELTLTDIGLGCEASCYKRAGIYNIGDLVNRAVAQLESRKLVINFVYDDEGYYAGINLGDGKVVDFELAQRLAVQFNVVQVGIECGAYCKTAKGKKVTWDVLKEYVQDYAEKLRWLTERDALLAELGIAPEILEVTVEDMDLSVRSYNCLKRAGYNKVQDMVLKTQEDLAKIRNLGKESLKEVLRKLNSYGIRLAV